MGGNSVTLQDPTESRTTTEEWLVWCADEESLNHRKGMVSRCPKDRARAERIRGVVRSVTSTVVCRS